MALISADDDGCARVSSKLAVDADVPGCSRCAFGIGRVAKGLGFLERFTKPGVSLPRALNTLWRLCGTPFGCPPAVSNLPETPARHVHCGATQQPGSTHLLWGSAALRWWRWDLSQSVRTSGHDRCDQELPGAWPYGSTLAPQYVYRRNAAYARGFTVL